MRWMRAPGALICSTGFPRTSPVGRDEDGTIGQVEVVPRWRRRGLAILMLGAARDAAELRGWPLPAHSAIRTSDGDSWAQSVGGDLPDLVPEERSERLRAD